MRLFNNQQQHDKNLAENLQRLVSPQKQSAEEGSNQEELLVKRIPQIVKLQALWRGYNVRKVFHYYRESNRNNQYFTYEEQMETLSRSNTALVFSRHATKEQRPAYRYKSGAVYEGEWIGGMRHGFGVMEWPDGARYEGQWEMNVAAG